MVVLDRIGTNSASTDNNPGGLIAHYDHGAGTELWGGCGTVWTQPFKGTLGEVSFVGFARVVNATNGMYLDPVTNLSAFTVSLHLWTNGAAGFLASTNPAHGEIVVPLGPGPSAPELFGATALTNTLTGTTNLFVSVLPTFRYTTNLAALSLGLEAGREYVLGLVFEATAMNVVVRQSTASVGEAPDVYAVYGATRGLASGRTTNAFQRPQFATAISVEPTGEPAITAQPQGGVRGLGSAYDLAVSVSGTGTLGYQWQHNGLDMLGATNPILSFSGLRPEDAGWYWVVVTNGLGVVTSTPAALSAMQFALDPQRQAEFTIYGPLPFGYRVDWADGLLPSNLWINLTNLMLTNNPGVVVDTDSTNAATRFYKVQPQ